MPDVMLSLCACQLSPDSPPPYHPLLLQPPALQLLQVDMIRKIYKRKFKAAPSLDFDMFDENSDGDIEMSEFKSKLKALVCLRLRACVNVLVLCACAVFVCVYTVLGSVSPAWRRVCSSAASV